jgi:hypothetical protein
MHPKISLAYSRTLTWLPSIGIPPDLRSHVQSVIQHIDHEHLLGSGRPQVAQHAQTNGTRSKHECPLLTTTALGPGIGYGGSRSWMHLYTFIGE